MAEEKTVLKSEEKPKKNGNENRVKTQNKKLWWILGGCCGCLFIIIILAALTSGFWGWRYNLWRTGADIPVSELSSTITATPSASKTSFSSNSYPEPQSCSQVSTPPSTALSVSSANPGLKKNVDMHYYNIYGSIKNQLSSQMSACGPKDGGGSWSAYTAYNINWRYNYTLVGSACGLENIAVGVQVDMYLPEWQIPESFTAGLDESWSSYISALTTHENGHRDYDIEGANKILVVLNNLGSYSSCEEASTAADAKGDEILDEVKSLNESYDATTNHGATQGAVLQ